MGKTLKVLELFGGIGACSKALTNLGVKHEIVDLVEIDRFAVKSFNAVHGTNFEPQDITKWDKDIEVDLIMHGSPCQDFSMAGLQAGGDEGSGTRSSLMYETIRIVEKLKPKYVIWENVKNLLSEKHRPNFEAYQARMKNLGYKNFVQVLNAKDYDIPQNRERVFTVSIREDLGQDHYEFPAARPLTKRLKDVLEDVVDGKYVLSQKMVDGMTKTQYESYKLENLLKSGDDIASTLKARFDGCPQCVQVGKLDMRGHDCLKRVYAPEGLSPTLTTMGGGNTEPKIVEPMIGAMRGRNPDNPSDRTPGVHTEQRLEINEKGVSNTLTTVQKDNLVVEPLPEEELEISTSVKPSVAKNIARESEQILCSDQDFYTCKADSGYQDNKVGLKVSPTLRANNSHTLALTPKLRVRKLTPKECWRLMGFADEDFEKASKVNSNTQLYKQAGNSIVVNVLEGILGNLLKGTEYAPEND